MHFFHGSYSHTKFSPNTHIILTFLLLMTSFVASHSFADSVFVDRVKEDPAVNNKERVRPIAPAEVVRLDAQGYTALLGSSQDHYLFSVVKGNALTIASHQIEKTAQSLWPSVIQNDFIHRQSERLIQSRRDSVLNEQDSFLLSAQDFGIRWSGHSFPEQTPLVLSLWLKVHALSLYEVVLSGPTVGVRYGYLWRLSAPVPRRFVSTEDYVTYDKETHFAETSVYSLGAALNNPLEWQDLVVGDSALLQSKSLLDVLKIRISARAIANTSTIQLSNTSIRSTVVSVEDGPFQARVRIQAKAIFGGAVVGRAKCQMIILPNTVQLEVVSHVPEWASYLLTQASLALNFDGANLHGARVSASGTPLKIGTVDGQMSVIESLFHKTGFRSGQYWWHLSLPSGVEVHSTLDLLSHPSLPVSLNYTDDARQSLKPERVIGQVPEIGYRIDQLPLKAPLAIVYTMKFVEPKSEFNLQNWLKTLSEPLTTSARALPLNQLSQPLQ